MRERSDIHDGACSVASFSPARADIPKIVITTIVPKAVPTEPTTLAVSNAQQPKIHVARGLPHYLAAKAQPQRKPIQWVVDLDAPADIMAPELPVSSGSKDKKRASTTLGGPERRRKIATPQVSMPGPTGWIRSKHMQDASPVESEPSTTQNDEPTPNQNQKPAPEPPADFVPGWGLFRKAEYDKSLFKSDRLRLQGKYCKCDTL